MPIRLKSLLLAVFIALFVLPITSCGSKTNQLQLNAAVGYSGNLYVTIQNNDPFNWVDVNITLNYDEENGNSGYMYSTQSIITGFYERIQTIEFKNMEGKPLMPQSELFNIKIQAKGRDGRLRVFTEAW